MMDKESVIKKALHNRREEATRRCGVHLKPNNQPTEVPSTIPNRILTLSSNHRQGSHICSVNPVLQPNLKFRLGEANNEGRILPVSMNMMMGRGRRCNKAEVDEEPGFYRKRIGGLQTHTNMGRVEDIMPEARGRRSG